VATPTLEDQIRVQFERRRVEATDFQLAQLASYIGLITKWNATVNLTALALSPLSDEAIDRLLIEPLIAARELPAAPFPSSIGGPEPVEPRVRGLGSAGPGHSQSASEDGFATPDEAPILVDIGSGGGSPAIPLKIVRPDFQLTMVESKARKSAFLRDVVRQLALPATTVVTDRLENLIETEPRPGQPVENRPVPLCGKLGAAVVSVRAVRADQGLWDAIGALLRPGGLVLWFRGEASGAGPQAGGSIELVEAKPLILERGSELALLRRKF
jgi:16S rRNA G527 N7-methylase RsmG